MLMPEASRIPQGSSMGENGFAKEFVEDVTEEGLQEALDRHRRAIYILTQKDRPIPSLKEMKEDLAKPEDLAYVKERIEELKEEHTEDLERMYATHTAEYLLDQEDKYTAADETQEVRLEDGEATWDEDMKNFFEASRLKYHSSFQWDDDYDRIRYTYLSRMIALDKQREALVIDEETARKQRESLFPTSAADFHSKPKDVQLRAARFLVAEKSKQERILTEFGWAWRQVEPLQDAYSKDEQFQAEIGAMILQDNTSDPRWMRFGV